MFNRNAQKDAALELLRLQGRNAEAEALKDASPHQVARVAAGLEPPPMRPQERPAWLDWPKCVTCQGRCIPPEHGPRDSCGCPLDRACPRCIDCGGLGRIEPE